VEFGLIIDRNQLGILGGSVLVLLASSYLGYSYYYRHKRDTYDTIPDPEANTRLVSLSPVNRTQL
jgi:hypothetical protein